MMLTRMRILTKGQMKKTSMRSNMNVINSFKTLETMNTKRWRTKKNILIEKIRIQQGVSVITVSRVVLSNQATVKDQIQMKENQSLLIKLILSNNHLKTSSYQHFLQISIKKQLKWLESTLQNLLDQITNKIIFHLILFSITQNKFPIKTIPSNKISSHKISIKGNP